MTTIVLVIVASLVLVLCFAVFIIGDRLFAIERHELRIDRRLEDLERRWTRNPPLTPDQAGVKPIMSMSELKAAIKRTTDGAIRDIANQRDRQQGRAPNDVGRI